MITSVNNPRLKRARLLLQYSKRRRAEKSLTLEGARLIGDAMESGVRPDYVLFRSGTDFTNLLLHLETAGVPCLEVDQTSFDTLGDTQTPQGIVAVCPWPNLNVPTQPSLTVILDRVSDPGNVGTILRTAGAVGVDLVILTPHSVDPFSPKVLRSAMGGHFRVPIRRWDWERIRGLDTPLIVADARAETTMYEVEWHRPLALVIGSEAEGPGQQALESATDMVRIPMAAGESLNAAVAASIILYEIYRRS